MITVKIAKENNNLLLKVDPQPALPALHTASVILADEICIGNRFSGKITIQHTLSPILRLGSHYAYMNIKIDWQVNVMNLLDHFSSNTSDLAELFLLDCLSASRSIKGIER